MITEKEKLRQVLYRLVEKLNMTTFWWGIDREYQNRITETQAHEIIELIKNV